MLAYSETTRRLGTLSPDGLAISPIPPAAPAVMINFPTAVYDVPAHLCDVKALVYVAAFAPDTGESVATLLRRFPGNSVEANSGPHCARGRQPGPVPST